MKLHNLKPAAGSTGKGGKRVGRGEGSGCGEQCGRGHKGAKSRSGFSHRAGFEGGQMPIQRRMPKYGFTNHTRVEYKAVNLSMLQELSTRNNISVINQEVLIAAGLVNQNDNVKILGNGELTASLNVTANAFSASAKAKIEEKGGSATII